jgi:hypothetical protein
VKGENGDVNGDTGEEEWWTLWGWGLGEFRGSMAFRATDQFVVVEGLHGVG